MRGSVVGAREATVEAKKTSIPATMARATTLRIERRLARDRRSRDAGFPGTPPRPAVSPTRAERACYIVPITEWLRDLDSTSHQALAPYDRIRFPRGWSLPALIDERSYQYIGRQRANKRGVPRPPASALAGGKRASAVTYARCQCDPALSAPQWGSG